MKQLQNKPISSGYEEWSDEILRAQTEESRLIAQEEQAERRVRRTRERLDLATERLDEAQRRVDRRKAQVLAAQDELKWCQQMRAAGPQPLFVPAVTEEA